MIDAHLDGSNDQPPIFASPLGDDAALTECGQAVGVTA